MHVYTGYEYKYRKHHALPTLYTVGGFNRMRSGGKLWQSITTKLRNEGMSLHMRNGWGKQHHFMPTMVIWKSGTIMVVLTKLRLDNNG